MKRFITNASLLHRNPSKRLTAEYFEQRGFKSGFVIHIQMQTTANRCDSQRGGSFSFLRKAIRASIITSGCTDVEERHQNSSCTQGHIALDIQFHRNRCFVINFAWVRKKITGTGYRDGKDITTGQTVSTDRTDVLCGADHARSDHSSEGDMRHL